MVRGLARQLRMDDFETRELSFEPTGQDACRSSCSACPTEAPA
jgi:hypothetical protein